MGGMYALLEADEEADSSVYAAYLRAQSDADLLDILLHLDPERYPARVDAARRETLRRRVLLVTVYSLEERAMRGLAVAAFVLSAVLVLLVWLLSPADAVLSRWPNLDTLPAGTTAAEIMRRMLLGLLRALVCGSADSASCALLLLTLTGWLLIRGWSRTVRRDAKAVVAGGLVSLGVALSLAASSWSSIPTLPGLSASGGFWARLLTLLFP